MAFTADEVVQLFEGEGSALDTICMENSDDELGLEQVEVVENPYYNHTPEFDDFEVIECKHLLYIHTKVSTSATVTIGEHTAAESYRSPISAMDIQGSPSSPSIASEREMDIELPLQPSTVVESEA